MKVAVLMDIDGTLTPPRQPLGREMAEALQKLKIPFHVAAGSDLVIVEPQFLKPLWDFGARRDFEAFVSNGSTHFHCPFSDRYAIEKVSEFAFSAHLGARDYGALVGALEGILAAPEFQMPESIRIVGERIMDRGSMLNFSPMGRPHGNVTEEIRQNRHRFAQFDRGTGYRREILARLNRELAGVIAEKKLRIMLGGETSFDIVIDGWDKTNAARGILKLGFERVVFLGDALFEGGNDSVISTMIQQWRGPGECPVSAVQVEGWEHTLRIFHERGWL